MDAEVNTHYNEQCITKHNATYHSYWHAVYVRLTRQTWNWSVVCHSNNKKFDTGFSNT